MRGSHRRLPTSTTARSAHGGRPLIAFDSHRFRVALVENSIRGQRDLAGQLGISYQRIQQIAAGLVPPAPVRDRIAAHLNLAALDLWPVCVRSEVA